MPALAKRNSIPRRGSTHPTSIRLFSGGSPRPTEFPKKTVLRVASRSTYRACRYFSVTSQRFARDYLVSFIANLKVDQNSSGMISMLREILFRRLHLKRMTSNNEHEENFVDCHIQIRSLTMTKIKK